MPKNIIVIGGPTASGKSALAIDLAQELDGVVINADASQVYKGIPIISAAPTAEDKAAVEHLMYEYLDVAVNGNVCMWLNEAVRTVREVISRGKTPIIVGGTGLYIDNLLNGTTPIPEVKPEIRNEVAILAESEGTSGVYEKLAAVDSAAAAMLNRNDATRVRRAYEIFLSTGKSIAEWYQQPMVQKLPEAEFLTISLLPPKPILDGRCDLRFEKMIAAGALEEVKYLLSRNLSPELPAMRAKGVPELIAALKNVISLDEAIASAQLHTRQYAKRQLTWFRNKFAADLVLAECYQGQKIFINDVKKQYKNDCTNQCNVIKNN